MKMANGMTNNVSLPEDGIEILVSLAKSGQIDPWNLDIVEVADEYLKAVAELKESDLKITGKTILYLAVLLRMKSDQLAGIDYLDPLEDRRQRPRRLRPVLCRIAGFCPHPPLQIAG